MQGEGFVGWGGCAGMAELVPSVLHGLVAWCDTFAPGLHSWLQESLEDQHRLYTQLPESHRAPSATALSQHPQQGCSTAQAPSLALHLSDGTLALLRSFKRSTCLNSLLEMGFPAAAAQAAADRAGAELEAAVALVMDGGGGGGAAAKQIDVSRCVGLVGVLPARPVWAGRQPLLSALRWVHSRVALKQVIPASARKKAGAAAASHPFLHPFRLLPCHAGK
jgi:hypothetical protein